MFIGLSWRSAPHYILWIYAGYLPYMFRISAVFPIWVHISNGNALKYGNDAVFGGKCSEYGAYTTYILRILRCIFLLNFRQRNVFFNLLFWKSEECTECFWKYCWKSIFFGITLDIHWISVRYPQYIRSIRELQSARGQMLLKYFFPHQRYIVYTSDLSAFAT